MTRSIGRTRLMAWIWVTAWAPHPTMPSVVASVRASTSVATADAAPVRSAVRKVASHRARSRPVDVSCSVVVANTLGVARSTGFDGWYPTVLIETRRPRSIAGIHSTRPMSGLA